MSTDSLKDLQDMVVRFRNERDWVQFHTPKEVATALAIEAAELQDLFLWDRRPAEHDVELELGDILVFALSFADVADIDPADAIREALAKAARKYPITKCKGKNEKYTDL